MQKHQFVIGIDVSKQTLDVCIASLTNSASDAHNKFSNDSKGYVKLIEWVKKNNLQPEKGLWVMEHTGAHSYVFCSFLHKNSIPFCLCAGLDIKYSIGMQRGKTDKDDAWRIARYAVKNIDDLSAQTLKSDVLHQLQRLINERNRLVKCRTILSAEANERKGMEDACKPLSKSAIEAINQSIKDTDRQIEELISQDDDLQRKAQLCRSVPGIGKVLTAYLLVVTHGFTRFKNARKLACYAGIAPFAYQSGTSIKGRARVHHYADKELKRLLHLGVISAGNHDDELKAYKKRKKGEGKHTQVVFNALKNKLLGRVFAVVNRDTPFVKMEKYRSVS